MKQILQSPEAPVDAGQSTASAVSPGSSEGGSSKRIIKDEVVVRCAGVSKIFRDFWLRNRVRAVDHIDLDIRRGEVFGLLGPNGSGKSTTIKMILGLLNPTSGRISVFGKRPEDVATKKLIGYLPEESYLYRFLNARETLEYYGRLFHQGRAQSQRRIDMLLEMVGLETAQRRPVGEYSKGMQRRIGLAQALINDPQLLILDEPTTGLDPIGTKQIKDLIVELANRGKTILLCSHLLSDVEDVCDRVSIMFGGKVRAQGTCDELLIQQSATTIQTPALNEQIIAEIKQVLERHGQRMDSVTHPRQKLEDLFLEIVHRAQKEGASTSGARAGGRIAGFLMEEEQRGSHLPEKVSAQVIIQELVSTNSSENQAASKQTSDAEDQAQREVQEAGRQAQVAQNQVLDSLVKDWSKKQDDASAGSASKTGASTTGKQEAEPVTAAVGGSDINIDVIDQLVSQGDSNVAQGIEPKPQVTPSNSSSAKAGQEQTEESGGMLKDAMNQVPPYQEPKDPKDNHPRQTKKG